MIVLKGYSDVCGPAVLLSSTSCDWNYYFFFFSSMKICLQFLESLKSSQEISAWRGVHKLNFT